MSTLQRTLLLTTLCLISLPAVASAQSGGNSNPNQTRRAPSFAARNYWAARHGQVRNGRIRANSDRLRAQNDRVRAHSTHIRAHNDGVRVQNDRIRAVSQAELLKSHARVNKSIAANQELENDRKRTENFWAARQLRQQQLDAKRKSARERVDQQQRILATQRPSRPTGPWPMLLREGELGQVSRQIIQSLKDRSPENALQNVRQLKTMLRLEVKLHPTADYLAAKKFLTSLEYGLTKSLRNGSPASRIASR